jgi:hypothetical protein
LIKFTNTDLPKSSSVGLITFYGDKVELTAEEKELSITFEAIAVQIDFEN